MIERSDSRDGRENSLGGATQTPVPWSSMTLSKVGAAAVASSRSLRHLEVGYNLKESANADRNRSQQDGSSSDGRPIKLSIKYSRDSRWDLSRSFNNKSTGVELL